MAQYFIHYSIFLLSICTDVHFYVVKDIEMLLEEKKELIKELIEEEIPEDVAKAAVQLAPSLDFNECYQWASKNFKNEALVSEYQKKFEEEDGM